MNLVTGSIGSENEVEYYSLPAAELIDQTLPSEMFSEILSHLNGKDMQSPAVVSRLWKQKVIKSAKHKELSSIKEFMKFLTENLKKQSYESQINNLFNVVSNTKILGAINLIEVKSSIDELKETFLNILKDFRKEDLIYLAALSKDQKKPVFFDDLFTLAKFYNTLEELKRSDDLKRDEALHAISISLTNNGLFAKAIEVANAIPQENIRRFGALTHAYGILMHKEKFDWAIEVAHTISEENNRRDNALRYISITLVNKGKVVKAGEVASSIKDPLIKKSAFANIH